MNINVIEKDLFTVDDSYYLAHCISADYVLGAGIAVQFNRRFNMRRRLKQVGTGVWPDCILVGRVFNLVTKERAFHKPTYDSLKESLEIMRLLAVKNHASKIAMPLIGCGLDQLEWGKVLQILKDVFWYTDIEILVCYLEKDKDLLLSKAKPASKAI